MYTEAVDAPPDPNDGPALASTRGRGRRRRPPSPHEQARRKAWGRTWGNVGHEYKVAREAKEKE